MHDCVHQTADRGSCVKFRIGDISAFRSELSPRILEARGTSSRCISKFVTDHPSFLSSRAKNLRLCGLTRFGKAPLESISKDSVESENCKYPVSPLTFVNKQSEDGSLLEWHSLELCGPTSS